MKKLEAHKKALVELETNGNAPENISHLKTFLTFLEENPTHTYYSNVKTKKAANVETDAESLAVLDYFTKGDLRLGRVSFIYHGWEEDNQDGVEVDRDIYFEYINDGLTPVAAETGNEIINFEEDKLEFEAFLRV